MPDGSVSQRVSQVMLGVRTPNGQEMRRTLCGISQHPVSRPLARGGSCWLNMLHISP